MKPSFFLALTLLAGLAAPTLLQADAAGDLSAGRAALAEGDVTKALPLLESASQAMPQSVEAQLELGRAYLLAGQTEKALAQFRRLLQLSPNHEQAKRVVEALSGGQQPVEEKLAQARTMIDLGLHQQTAAFLTSELLPVGYNYYYSIMSGRAMTAAQRRAARMLLAEAWLWQRFKPDSLPEIAKAINETASTPDEKIARVMAALSLVSVTTPENLAAADAMLKAAGDGLPAPWKQRAQLVRYLANIKLATAADTSAAMAEMLNALPPGGLKTELTNRLIDWFVWASGALAEQGDMDTALKILWPMVSAAPRPADLLAGPPTPAVQLAGGWVPATVAEQYREKITNAFVQLANRQFMASHADANLVGYWLASEYQRQLPMDANQGVMERRLALAGALSSMSAVRADRKAGEPLSSADQIQFQILIGDLPGKLVNEDLRARLATMLAQLVQRYRAAGEWKTIIGLLVNMPTADKAASLKVELPPGPAQRRLTQEFVSQLAELGAEQFAKPGTAEQPDKLNDYDLAALQLSSQLRQAGVDSAHAGAIIDRYAAADKWSAVTQAVAALYSGSEGDAAKWAAIRQRNRQAFAAEDKLLTAQRQLPDKLAPGVVESLNAAVEIVKNDPSEGNKNAAIDLAGSLSSRYQQLDRYDLAEAVIAAVSESAQLADWALMARADLLETRAVRALLQAAASFNGVGKLKLVEQHAAELKLLGELVDKFPDSKLVNRAIARVASIAQTYANYKAFDTATAVLADFLKPRPNIRQAEGIEWQRVQIVLSKATDAFANRPVKDRIKPPENLLPEHAAAIDELVVMIKTRVGSPLVPLAESELVGIARMYGQSGGWSVAREVLKRYAAAVPDMRTPQRLRLMEAGTYLGELDRQHGLSLLSSAAPPSPPALPETAPLPCTSPAGPVGAGTIALADDRWKWREGDKAKSDLSAEPQRAYDESHEVPGEALAMIRQAEAQQAQRIARMQPEPPVVRQPAAQQGQQGAPMRDLGELVLPRGAVLSEAEMKRQDAAADAGYAILIELVRQRDQAGLGQLSSIAAAARSEILWLVGFFEGQLRANRAVVLIEQFIKDQPADPARIELALRAVNDRLAWAAQRQPGEKIDQAWIDSRHELFEVARAAISQFIERYGSPMDGKRIDATRRSWVDQARMLTVNSFQTEGELIASVSAARAGGLLTRSADELLAIANSEPDHAQAGQFPSRLFNTAVRLASLGQRDQAIYVLGQLVVRYPSEQLAMQSLLKIAELYSADLSQPLRAVETYQEYISLAGDSDLIRSQIYGVAQQLASRQRYLEALHVYGVFVDNFPTDPRAAQALLAIGRTHQANGAWNDAISAYQRILDEYPGNAIVQQVKLAMAECHVQLSQWRQARQVYSDYIEQYPQDGQSAVARDRIEVLKSLDRFQTLLADKEIKRNRDDAQFQIGRIVLERLTSMEGSRVKAIEEFRKVVADYPKSDLADDAQFEIGKALMELGRLGEARQALLRVADDYPTSPLADDALYQIGQSYEQQAGRLAGVTIAQSRAVAFEAGQRGAYQEFQKQAEVQGKMQSARRQELKRMATTQPDLNTALEIEEAYNVYRYSGNSSLDLSNISRKAEQAAETESALQVANRQDRINEAYRQAVAAYARAADEHKLGDATDDALLRMADIYEVHLKDRDKAMETYQQVVKFFPGTPVAENAAWKVAKFHEAKGEYDQAVVAYREFIRNYPASSRVADAQYAMAEALEQLGRWVEAMDAYQTFRDKFASHPKAPAADQQIQWIKAYRR